MPKSRQKRLAFGRAMVRGEVAIASGNRYAVASGPTLDATEVHGLIASGALAGDAHGCRANAATRNWLKRQMLESEPFRAQHMTIAAREGLTINVAESPIARLAIARGKDGTPFLDRHHVEAAERLRRLVERAAMQPRVTMSYSPAHSAGNSANGPADMSDMVAEARRELANLHAVLPRDCMSIAVDVCGLLKGLQQVEAERGWPRRSAKLVLRIALECLAARYGLGSAAIGQPSHRPHNWRDDGARPDRFE